MATAVLLALRPPAHGQDTDGQAGQKDRGANLALVEQSYAADLAAHGTNADMRVRRGLLADRRARRVRVWAEGIALRPGEPAEFFLISEKSGHGYEALAVSFARPSDIHEALEFIGVPPGQPANPGRHRFWPKGERVMVTFKWSPPSIAGEPDPPPVEVPAERLVKSLTLGGPLPVTGFVFTGSRRVPHPQIETQTVYAADMFEPNSIMSDYNDSDTVLDVPRLAQQSDVYSTQVPSLEPAMRQGGLIEVTMRPEYADGRRRVLDLRLDADAGGGTGIVFTVADTNGTVRLKTADAGALLELFTGTVKGGQDPFVTFAPGDGLTIRQAREVCAVLAAMEGESGIRMEPPPPGLPFFRAFLPEERFRRREDRPAQPRELRFSTGTNGLQAVLVDITENWPEDAETPTLEVAEHPVASPSDLMARLAVMKKGLPVMLIFAPAALPFGAIRPYVEALLPRHSTLYVFPEPP